MNSHPDPAFEIKQQLDREVAQRFDARRIHALHAPELRDSRAARNGPLARIPVPVQWLGIAAAVIAAVTGLRSLYVDLARGSVRPAPVELVSAPPSQPTLAPDFPSPAPVFERAVEPPRRHKPRTPVIAPPEPRERPTPTIGGAIVFTGSAPVVVAESVAPPADSIAQATPPAVVDAAPEPARVVEPERAERGPTTFAPSAGIVAGMPGMLSGGVAHAAFSARGQSLQTTVREVPLIGATIVSLVGAPAFTSDAPSPSNRRAPRPASARASSSSSYYIRLLAGSKSGFPSVAEPTLVSKILPAGPSSASEELWGSIPHRAFLRSAFDLGPVVALAGVRTAAPSPNREAQADLVVAMMGGVFRIGVSAAPIGDESLHRFEVRLSAEERDRTLELEGALYVERDRVVVLALPDPRRLRWRGGGGPAGATVFVVLSPHSEEAGRHPVADQDVDPPILISGPEPRYPEEVRWRQATGTVVVRALVGKDGSVDDPQVLEAPTGPDSKSLIDSAIAAVSEREYLPARRNGEPVDAYVTVTIEFKLDGASIRGDPGE